MVELENIVGALGVTFERCFILNDGDTVWEGGKYGRCVDKRTTTKKYATYQS